jgi:hypothetical protein
LDWAFLNFLFVHRAFCDKILLLSVLQVQGIRAGRLDSWGGLGGRSTPSLPASRKTAVTNFREGKGGLGSACSCRNPFRFTLPYGSDYIYPCVGKKKLMERIINDGFWRKHRAPRPNGINKIKWVRLFFTTPGLPYLAFLHT